MKTTHILAKHPTGLPEPTGRFLPAGKPSVRFHLRTATRDEHQQTEAAFAGFRLPDRGGYAGFLRAHETALRALEGAMTGRGWESWSSRRDLLEQDLAGLGSTGESLIGLPPIALSDAEVWGAQYVIEGSRLGGAILSRQLPANWPCAYLGRNPDERPWQLFCTALESEYSKQDDGWLAEVETGAHKTFASYRHAAQRIAECPSD